MDHCHLMPTLSPILRVEGVEKVDVVGGPMVTMRPTPSWPPIWPGRIGCLKALSMRPRSEWQTPEWVLRWLADDEHSDDRKLDYLRINPLSIHC